MCGKAPSDPHHYPVRRSQGATDEMWEMVPLCREHHDAVHHGRDREFVKIFEDAAQTYLRMEYGDRYQVSDLRREDAEG